MMEMYKSIVLEMKPHLTAAVLLKYFLKYMHKYNATFE